MSVKKKIIIALCIINLALGAASAYKHNLFEAFFPGEPSPLEAMFSSVKQVEIEGEGMSAYARSTSPSVIEDIITLLGIEDWQGEETDTRELESLFYLETPYDYLVSLVTEEGHYFIFFVTGENDRDTCYVIDMKKDIGSISESPGKYRTPGYVLDGFSGYARDLFDHDDNLLRLERRINTATEISFHNTGDEEFPVLELDTGIYSSAMLVSLFDRFRDLLYTPGWSRLVFNIHYSYDYDPDGPEAHLNETRLSFNRFSEDMYLCFVSSREDRAINGTYKIPGETYYSVQEFLDERLWEQKNTRIDDAVNLLELTEEEMKTYNWYKQARNDTILSGQDPLTICKFYLYAGYTGDRETEYALLLQEDLKIDTNIYPVLWTMEEHYEMAGEADPDVFRYATWPEVTYYGDGRVAVISWTNDFVAPRDADGESFVFTFMLLKNERGIWKVQFLPMS